MCIRSEETCAGWIRTDAGELPLYAQVLEGGADSSGGAVSVLAHQVGNEAGNMGSSLCQIMLAIG